MLGRSVSSMTKSGIGNDSPFWSPCKDVHAWPAARRQACPLTATRTARRRSRECFLLETHVVEEHNRIESVLVDSMLPCSCLEKRQADRQRTDDEERSPIAELGIVSQCTSLKFCASTHLDLLPQDRLETKMMVSVHMTDVDHTQFLQNPSRAFRAKSPTELA